MVFVWPSLHGFFIYYRFPVLGLSAYTFGLLRLYGYYEQYPLFPNTAPYCIVCAGYPYRSITAAFLPKSSYLLFMG